jgi:hypothetical protein
LSSSETARRRGDTRCAARRIALQQREDLGRLGEAAVALLREDQAVTGEDVELARLAGRGGGGVSVLG